MRRSLLLVRQTLTIAGAIGIPARASAADFDHALLIIVDDLGTDKVGAYADDVYNPGESRPSTPTLDLLATAGVRFTDAWATPICSPTRAMLYSGDVPSRNGVGMVISDASTLRLEPDPPTFVALAQQTGLATGMFGKWHVGERLSSLDAPGVHYGSGEYPIELGFDVFAGNSDAMLTSYVDWLYTVSEPMVPGARRYRTTAIIENEPAHERLNADALAWMGEVADRRHLTVASYNLVHTTADPVTGGQSWADGATACGAVPGTQTEDQAAMVECVDAAIGELLASAPDLESTLVVVLGDNGTDRSVAEGLFADGRGKNTIYESGIRVPLFLADGAAVQAALTKGVVPTDASYLLPPGEVVNTPTSIVDLYATFVDYLDLDTSSCTLGVTCARDSLSLRSTLEGGTPERDEVWSEYFGRPSGTDEGGAALRVGDIKLVVRQDRGTDCRRYALYDLAADRWEATDLFDDPAYELEKVAMLRRLKARELDMTVRWMPNRMCPR